MLYRSARSRRRLGGDGQEPMPRRPRAPGMHDPRAEPAAGLLGGRRAGDWTVPAPAHRRRGIAGGAVRKPLAGKAGGRGKRRPPGRPGPGCGVAVRHRRPRPDEAAGQDRAAGASRAKRCPAGLGLVSDPNGWSLCRAGSARRPRVPTLTGGRGLLEPGPAGSPGAQRSAGGRPWGPAGRVGALGSEDFVARSCENSTRFACDSRMAMGFLNSRNVQNV